MCGNEILLNLENAEYLRMGELIGGLTALGRIKNQQEHDWNEHPWTDKVFSRLKTMLG